LPNNHKWSAAHIGYVPQLLSADHALDRLRKSAALGGLYLIPRAARRTRIAAALKMMGLEGAAPKLVEGYSGGMIRRLEIARA